MKHNITFEDTKLIRDSEGHFLKAYLCPAGKWTISYGLTGPNIKKGLVITKEQSLTMFMTRIKEACAELDSVLKVSLSKNKYIALLDFVWNFGISKFRNSSLLKIVNVAPDSPLIRKKLSEWVWAKNPVTGVNEKLPGLITRRQKEADLYFSLGGARS